MPAQARPACKPSISLKLVMPCCDDKECETISRALEPDNRTAPQWLRIEQQVRDGKLIVHIEAPLEKGMSVRATVDEIIEYAYSLLKTVESIGGCSKRSPS